MDICCAGALTLDNGLSILVTMDPKGQMLIFGWTKDMPQTTEPLAKCSALSHPVYLTVYPFGQCKPLAICVSVIDVFNRIAVYFIDLSNVVNV
uniref:Uncharacterized protein n=1 Tax=Panagrolaimus sp. JU765 TaxID=591449 RepID=A0AC34QZV8_9BILA